MNSKLLREMNLLKYSVDNIESISQKEIRFINSNKEFGFLEVQIQKFNEKSWIIYNVKNKISLKDYLATNKITIFNILPILTSIKNVFYDKNILIDLSKIFADLDTIFVVSCNDSLKVYYTYLPMNNLPRSEVDYNEISKICKYMIESINDINTRNEYLNIFMKHGLRGLINSISEIQNKQSTSLDEDNELCFEDDYENIKKNNHSNVSCTEKRKSAFTFLKEILKRKKKEKSNYDYNCKTQLLMNYETNILDNDEKTTLLCGSAEIETIFDHKIYKILSDKSIIGRDNMCDVKIANSVISKKHAEIVKEGLNYFIIDLGSTNSTYLNKKRLKPNSKYQLNNKDIIVFGNIKCKFTIF